MILRGREADSGCTVGYSEAIGRRTSDQEIAACFNCHATGGLGTHRSIEPMSEGSLTLASVKPGVSCERCHAGADAHMQAEVVGKAAPIPRKLGEMAAEEMSNFCGECHRSWDYVVRHRLFGDKYVRFAPYRLANSRCFLGDDKRIRCTACHDPHAELVRDDAHYDKVCLSCHGAKLAEGAVTVVMTQKVCRVPAQADVWERLSDRSGFWRSQEFWEGDFQSRGRSAQ
jgi:hypothetical protein